MPLKKNIPNTLSTIRLFMAILIPYVFPKLSIPQKIIYFISGNATDALDGYLARKWKVQSRYGKIVDPIADKSFNLLSLIFTSITLNPLLLGIVIGEATIATITSLHTISNIKSKNIDMSKLNFSSKLKLFAKTADELNVSRIGRKKAIFMTGSVAMALLASLVPAMSLPASILIILTTMTEIPVISKYATEYYIDKKNYNMESSIECNVTKKDLEKLRKARELLTRFSKLDKQSDKMDEKALNKFKNKGKNQIIEEIKPQNIELDQEPIIIDNHFGSKDSNGYAKTYKPTRQK